MSILDRPRCIRRRKSRLEARLDVLESRLLMSASVVEYPVPSAGVVSGTHITADAQGNLYSMSVGGGILKLNPTTGEQTLIGLPSETAPDFVMADVTFGPDGNLWVTESFYNPASTGTTDIYLGDVLKVSTSGTVLATYNVGTVQPLSPTVGADGRIYMTAFVGLTVDDNNVPAYDTEVLAMNTNGTFVAFQMPTSDAYATDIAAAADGTIYVALTGTYVSPNVGTPYASEARLAVIRDGTLSLVSLAGGAANPHGQLLDVAVAPDGAVWLPLYTLGSDGLGTDTGVNQIVKVTLDGALTPTFTAYAIPGEAPDAFLYNGSIVAATDGSVYVAEFQGQYIDRVNTATDTVDRIALPSGFAGPGSPVQAGNAVYFSESFTGNFARIDLPVVGQGDSVAALTGQEITTTVAVLSTTLGAADIANLSAVIAWGDSTTSVGRLVDNGNGTVSVVGTHTYAADGDYATDVVVTGAGIDAVRVSGDATVVAGVTFAASGLTLAAHGENASFSALVASFIGPADTYTVTINWGNGVTSAGQVVLVSGVYQVIGTNSYATQGNYNITVTITGTANSATVNSSVQITDTPLVVTGAAPLVLLGRIAIGTTAYFTDDTDSRLNNYNASINWGDGKSSSGVVLPTGTAGQYMVIGVHMYSRRGAYTLTTTVVTVRGEDLGATASGSVVLRV